MTITTSRDTVLIEDEALRDGLQMEARIFNLDEKLKVFQMLKEAGVPRIQVGSFVHPKIVPQMADTDAFIKTWRSTTFRKPWPKRGWSGPWPAVWAM